MQYSKWGTIANRHGKQQERSSEFMPCKLSGFSFRLLAVLLPLGLGACADTLTSKETTSSTTLQRDYDKTLTKSEKKAIIDDLQSATAKQQAGEAPETASTGTPPAEQQN